MLTDLIVLGVIIIFKIFIVEDDDKMAALMQENLVKWGYAGVKVKNFKEVFEEYTKNQPDLILMDINLPFYDGFYWSERIRRVSKVPIIFLSSRSESMDIIMAINMGGDDYITKPFSLEVLVAKIQALLRRTYSYQDNSAHIVEHRGAVLNQDNSTLTHAEKTMELTRNEFKILLMLMRHAGTILSREKLMQGLWDDASFIDDNTLTVNINRLRKKLTDLGLNDFISTKKNQGYIVP